jgi:hypothetical protein
LKSLKNAKRSGKGARQIPETEFIIWPGEWRLGERHHFGIESSLTGLQVKLTQNINRKRILWMYTNYDLTFPWGKALGLEASREWC